MGEHEGDRDPVEDRQIGSIASLHEGGLACDLLWMVEEFKLVRWKAQAFATYKGRW